MKTTERGRPGLASNVVRVVSGPLAAAILALGVSLSPVQAQPAQVDIFTDATHPLTGLAVFQQRSGARVTVHDLSAPQTLIRQTLEFGGLPANPQVAQQLVMQRLAARPGFKDELRVAYGGHQRALTLGIDRIPAIVFDGQQVIYGVTDLAEAWGHYRHWAAGR